VPHVLLITSNGTGMGHLTRQTAVAAAIGNRADVTLVSLSSGLAAVADQVADAGVRCEYIPSYQKSWVPRMNWNDYLAQRVVAIATEVKADVIAFDGVAPYHGLMQARQKLPGTAFVWIRRGMWRFGANRGALRSEPFFDLVIEPGDLAAAADVGATASRTAERIAPISILDVRTPLSRAKAAQALGLDPARQTVLVTLGSGALGETGDEAAAAIAVATKHGMQIATTQAALQSHVDVADNVVVLRGVYPLADYVNAFDLVISAAGYNAVHEFVSAGIATVLVPNAHTATDDQAARARTLEAMGVAVWADPELGTAAVESAVERAIESADQLRGSATALNERGGAGQAADLLVQLAEEFTGDDPDFAQQAARLRYLARSMATRNVARVIGPNLTNRLRRSSWTGAAGPTEPLAVDLYIDPEIATHLAPETFIELGAVSPPAIMTNRLESSLLRGSNPIEHLISGSSTEYARERLRIARTAYRVQRVVNERIDQ